MPTTNLDIDRISSLCCPVFEEIHSCHPSFMWAGVFGSVSRGTQRSDSDVDIVVGYSPDADFFVDVCGSMALFLKRLPETLGVEVDVIAFIQRTKTFRYVDMEAILTAKTIWGDVSWPEASRDTAVDLLQQGYARIKKAGEMMSHIRRTLLATEVLIVKVTSSAITNEVSGRTNVSGARNSSTITSSRSPVSYPPDQDSWRPILCISPANDVGDFG
jgi:predicted nucleotidyltransferase